jgi:uncharacterized protein (TIGR00255 family)
MRSMTGYGQGSADAPTARVTVEVRGVNQRFLDVKVGLPREYAAWEATLRDQVRGVAQRGRVEVTVQRVPVAAARRYRVAVRRDLARAYVEAARDLGRSLGLGGTVTITEVLRLPDLLEVQERTPDVQRELPSVKRALGLALRAFDRERQREGRHLQGDMLARTAGVRRAAATMRRLAPRVTAALRGQVEERLAKLLGGVTLDAGRVAHEVALLAERSDLTEELVRLESHLAALAAALRTAGPVGKRIDFLLQEVHRELNTAGAKAQDLALGATVLEARGEVEKLREQVQNVE